MATGKNTTENEKKEATAGKPEVVPEICLVDAARSYWLNQLEQIEHHLGQIDAGQFSSETIHDLRVAARRISSNAILCQPFLAKGWAKDLNKLLRPIRKATNALRDVDVLINRLEAMASQDETVPELIARLTTERSGLADRAIRKLSEKSFRKALATQIDQLDQENSAIELLREPETNQENELVTLFNLSDVRLAILGRQAAEISFIHQVTPDPSQLPDAVRSDPDLLAGFLEVPESIIHVIRLGVKDFRYALEFLKPALNARSCSNLIRQFKRLQDQLGTIHDLDLAVHKLNDMRIDNETLNVETIETINRAWRQERQTLLQTFLKKWYGMKPGWFEQQVQMLLASSSD